MKAVRTIMKCIGYTYLGVSAAHGIAAGYFVRKEGKVEYSYNDKNVTLQHPIFKFGSAFVLGAIVWPVYYIQKSLK